MPYSLIVGNRLPALLPVPNHSCPPPPPPLLLLSSSTLHSQHLHLCGWGVERVVFSIFYLLTSACWSSSPPKAKNQGTFTFVSRLIHFSSDSGIFLYFDFPRKEDLGSFKNSPRISFNYVLADEDSGTKALTFLWAKSEKRTNQKQGNRSF